MFFCHTGPVASFADFIEALLDDRLISEASLAEMHERTGCPCYGVGGGSRSAAIVPISLSPGRAPALAVFQNDDLSLKSRL